MSPDLFFISRLIILLAMMLGISTYRYTTFFYKLLYTHVAIALLIENIGHSLVVDSVNTTPLYNFYILVDIPILLLAAGSVLKLKHNKTISLCSIVTFALVWSINIAQYGLYEFANWSFVLGSILLCAFYLTLIVEQYAFQKDISLRSPIVWSAAAIIIYYASNVPTFSFMKVLYTYSEVAAEKMYNINHILSIVHYICLGITFYLLRPSSPKAPTT